MLRSSDDPSFDQLIHEHPLTVTIPPQVQLELRERGPMSARSDDIRVVPRFRCRGPAILEWVESLSAMPRPFPASQVVVRNLSRTGFSVLMDRELFPEQMVRVYLSIATATATVVRARRLGSRCYDIGFRIKTYQSRQ